MARRGGAWQGSAWRGEAWQGKAGQGKEEYFLRMIYMVKHRIYQTGEMRQFLIEQIAYRLRFDPRYFIIEADSHERSFSPQFESMLRKYGIRGEFNI